MSKTINDKNAIDEIKLTKMSSLVARERYNANTTEQPQEKDSFTLTFDVNKKLLLLIELLEVTWLRHMFKSKYINTCESC